jgi:nucleoside 2-deoxyribosyltransferase
MRIYVGHPSSIDYKKNLYKPIRNSKLNNIHEFILPHETNEFPTNTLETMATFDLMIAEVSEPSTGLGIEMGWAHAKGIPILAIHCEENKVSSSINTITKNIESYSEETLIDVIANSLN